MPRILPSDVGVELQRGRWTVPPILTFLVQQAGLDEYEAYRTFNMGLGMLVILNVDDVEAAQTAVPELIQVGAAVEATADERVRLV